MFDLRKLEALLDALEKEKQYPEVHPVLSKAWPRRGVYAPVANPALEQKMDKYDIFKQPDYQNVGTMEFPIWAKTDLGSITMEGLQDAFAELVWPTYGGINRSNAPTPFWATPMRIPLQYVPMAYSPYDETPTPPPPPIETRHQKLQKKIVRLQSAPAVKIANPKPPEPTPARSPDYVHTLTAWRGWAVCAGQLESLGTDFDWVPKRAQNAHCQHENHVAPAMNCGCGFWSFKSLELLTEALKGYMDTVMVIGTVEIWGRVIECENGFRSEFAYPKELWLLDEDNDLSQLSWKYGVPVRKYVPPCTALVPYKKTK
jgi:hypothetical protein